MDTMDPGQPTTILLLGVLRVLCGDSTNLMPATARRRASSPSHGGDSATCAAARHEEADEPGVVVQRFQRGDDEAAPRQRAADRGRARSRASSSRDRRRRRGKDPPAAVRAAARSNSRRPARRQSIRGRPSTRAARCRCSRTDPRAASTAESAMPRMPVMSPPVLKLMNLGNALAKSFAGETTFAAMLTAMRRDDDGEHRDGDDDRRAELADELHGIPDRLAVDDRRRAGDHHAHRRKHRHRRRQRDDLADDLFALAAAEAREVRHVERQRRPETDHRGQRRHEHRPEFAEGLELPRLREQRPEAVGSARPPTTAARRS